MLKIFILIFGYHAFAFDHEHTLLTKVLSQSVHRAERSVLINYKKLKNSSDLKAYVAQLEQLTEAQYHRFSRNQKICFWVNLYNSSLINLIIKKFPIKSFTQLQEQKWFFFKISPYDVKFINSLGQTYGLNNIKYDILLKKFKRPEVIFALLKPNHHSPYIRKTALTPSTLNAYLDQAPLEHLTNPYHAQFDHQEKVVMLGSLIKTDKNQFERKYGSLKIFITKKIKNLDLSDYKIRWKKYPKNYDELNIY